MLVPIDFITFFCASSFLLLNNFFQIFILLCSQSFGDFNFSKFNLNLHSTCLLFLLVECHIIVWFFVSFDINLKTIECLFFWLVDIFFVYFNCLSFEELLNAWLCDYTVISSAVSYQSTFHISLIIMGTSDLFLWMKFYSINQF